MAQPTPSTQGRSNRGFAPAQELAMPPTDGGKITGPGTGTSDSIPDAMQTGTFIMPADSTKALGIQTLNQLANMPALQGDFTPEQAHAAGIAFLSSLRDATHKRVEQAEKPPEQFNFANGGQVAFHELEPLGLDRVAGRMQTKGPGKEEYNKKYAFGPGTGRAMAPYNFMTGKENKSYSGRYANGGMVNDRPALGGYRYSELPTKDEIDSAVGAQEQATQAKLAQLRASNPMGSISESQGRQAEIKGAERQLSSLKSAREVGRQQLAHGPGQGSLSGDFGGMNGAMALSDALQKQKGMKVVGVRGDMGGASAERMQLANGGPVRQASGPRGFTPQALAGGGTVIDQDNIYPQGHPSAGKDIYAGAGPQALGSSGQFVAVPDGVIGQQPPKVQQVSQAPMQGPPVSAQIPTGGLPNVAPQQAPQPKQEVQQPKPAPKQEPAPQQKATPDPSTSGLNAPWWSPEYVRAANASDKSGLELEQMRRAKAAPQDAPANDPIKSVVNTGAFGSGDTAVAPKPGAKPAAQPKAAPSAEQAPSKPTAEVLQEAQSKATSSLQRRLAIDGREGMTNAEVAQANPQGVVTAKRGANGVMEFSGNNVRGDVSYAGADGQPMQGGGLRAKGFGGFAVAPAGANVAMGPNGSYGFSTDPAQRGQPQLQPQNLGFAPYGQQQTSDPMAGMTVEQRLQYTKEVQAANASTRASQITQEMQGPKHLRDWNDLRSPLGIARRNLEFDMKNGPIDRTLSGRGGAGSGGNSIAQQAAASAYGQLAANSFKGDGVTEFDRQKYADGQARQQMLDQHGVAKDQYSMAKDERQYQDGAIQRGYEQQMVQLTTQAVNPNATPEQRADALKLLNAAQGKGGMQIKAVDLPDQLAPDGMTKMKGGQALVAIYPDGRVQQINPQQGQGGQGDAQPLPADPSQRKAGSIYTAPNGTRVKWDGKGAVAVQ